VFKALAEFVMRGRFQAVVVILIGSWLPLVSQAALGLVALRKGWQEALLLLLWAILPAMLAFWLGQVGVAISLTTGLVFAVGCGTALYLRGSVNWPKTLYLTSFLGGMSGLIMALANADLAAEIGHFFQSQFGSADAEIPEELRQMFFEWNIVSASGLIAFWVAMTSVLGLLLARWWQALLYNPGGFEEEFHSIRLGLPLVVFSAVAWCYCAARGSDLFFWQQLFGMPLLLAGLSLVHWAVKRFEKGTVPLVVLYFALFIVPIAAVAVMALALADALVNLRNKFEMNQPPQR